MAGRCELAAFLKEMIIRLFIIGTSLAKSKSISRASVSCERETSHTAFPLPTGDDGGWLVRMTRPNRMREDGLHYMHAL